ncbi:MAG: 2'-5' RNA ligase family protein [Chelatococcus sp.]|uniref:2'-5' RNA ligase family protein n=1 Tax=Chelatococcus sp. TaxID=1953771 RepID=UPI0025BE910B|nr:2'-5' RNA ligase family protein [Chelatococcus sp.]MBX3539235.1 2'-5' RNA ligase family protein [Chelatococcus sp.]
MQDQLDLFRDERWRPRFPERLFFCLLPDRGSATKIARFSAVFRRENAIQGDVLKPGRLHVSLYHVGDYKRLPTHKVYASELAARTIGGQAFEVTFSSVGSFRPAPKRGGGERKHPLVLLAEAGSLQRLHEALVEAMRGHGLSAADTFKPHMTLAYCPGPVPFQSIGPIRFKAKAFTLIHSERGLGRYHEKGRWPLADA